MSSEAEWKLRDRAERRRARSNWFHGRGLPPYGRLPAKVRRYESLYDQSTGAWIEAFEGVHAYASVELEVGRLWYALVMLLRPKRVLETGTYRGYSSCNIAAGLRDIGGGKLITIDPDPLPHLWEGTELAPFIDFVNKRSQDAVASLPEAVFDMLVLDSDHHYDTIVDELMLFEPMLRDGGVILMHDSLYFDGVGAAVAQLERNARFELVTLDSPRSGGDARNRPPGVTIVRKRRSGEPRIRKEPKCRGLFVGDPTEPPVLRAVAGGVAPAAAPVAAQRDLAARP